jgi:hypothetical protein
MSISGDTMRVLLMSVFINQQTKGTPQYPPAADA